MPRWERPNPPRLNDTAAIRKKSHDYTYKARGSHMTNTLEDMCAAEFSFGRNGPDLGMSGQHGAGIVIKTPHEHKRSSSPSPDKNRTVPGNGGSLAAAIACVNKGC